MTVVTRYLQVQTEGENDIIDLTDKVQEQVTEANLISGVVTVFVLGSTGAVTTIEYEPGLMKDFPRALERLAPSDDNYEHQKMWHDGNGRSHVKASLIGPSLTIPFIDGVLALGTWQQVVFVELDIRPRTRKIVLQLVGG